MYQRKFGYLNFWVSMFSARADLLVELGHTLEAFALVSRAKLNGAGRTARAKLPLITVRRR